MITATVRATQQVLSRLPAVAVLLGVAAGSAGAQATINVNSTLQVVAPTAPSGNNDGMCSLSEAIVAANSNSAVDSCTAGQSGGTDTIMLPAGTYTLSTVDNNSFGFGPTGLPVILAPVLIQGAAAATTIIERSTVAGTPAMRAFFFQDALTLNNLTVRNFAGANGAVAFGRGGELITTDCVLTGNDGGAAGSSVYYTNFGIPATFNNTVITNNTSTNGGAISALFGRLTFNNTLVANNTGAAEVIRSEAGGGVDPTLSITDSTIRDNTSTSTTSGGVSINALFSVGTLTVTRSVFSGNSGSVIASGGGRGGGGLHISGTPTAGINASITDSVFSGNTQPSDNGGGIDVSGRGGTLTITRSLITGNSLLSGGSGGGIFVGFGVAVTIRNSTISGNSSVGRGGGVSTAFQALSDSLTLNNVTITNNSAAIRGGGLDQFGSLGTITLSNTVLAGNSSAGSNPDCASDAASLVSLGFNLLGENTGCTLTAASGDVVGTGAAPINPLLQALADNGSAVMAGANIPGFATPMVIQTRAVFTGSPALNAANTATPLDGASGRCEATDQRGLPRPGGVACDMGAFEDQTGNGVPIVADVGVSKTDSPDPVTVNTNLTYTITVTNAGPDAAPTTALNDPLPATANFVSLTAPAGWSCTTPAVGATGTVICTHSALPSGASDVFTLVVTPTPASPASISNTATVSTLANDGNSGNDSATATTAVTGLSADLTVSKSDSPDPINLGAGNISYAIAVTNNGPGAATNAALNDVLPAGVNFASLAAAAGWTCSMPAVGTNGTVNCTNPSVAASSTHNFTLVVTPTATGTVSNTATVSATEADPVPGNNTATASTTVNASADLDANKADAADPVLAGSNITYTLNVQNLGPSPATNVVLVDTLPVSVTFVSVGAPCVHNAGIVTCNFGGLAAGAFTPNVTLVVTTTGASVPSVINTSVATANEPDPVAANNTGAETTTVNPLADISVAKTDSPDPVNVGSNLTYTVTVSNAGPSPATAVNLTDTLPAGLTFVSATPSAGTCTGTTTASCSLGTINSGSSVTVTIVATVTAAAPASLSNTATATSGVTDPNAANNTATTTTAVNAVANLGVTITDAPDPVSQGSNITYTVTVNNAGPSAAANVTATTALPANTTFVSASATAGTCALASGTITCTMGTMASGASVTATVILTANAAGAVSATVTVASTTTDPTPGNNSATASTTVNAATTDFGLNVTPTSQFVAAGQSTSFTATATPAGTGATFTSAVTFSCLVQLQVGVSCAATPATVAAGASVAASTINITTTARGLVPLRGPQQIPWPLLWLVAFSTLLLLAGVAGRRMEPLAARTLRGWSYCATLGMVLLVASLLLTQAACGQDNSGVPRGPVGVTVTATSGPVSRSFTVNVILQ